MITLIFLVVKACLLWSFVSGCGRLGVFGTVNYAEKAPKPYEGTAKYNTYVG